MKEVFPKSFVEIENKLAKFKPSAWKYDRSNLSPHDGALTNLSEITLDNTDSATMVMAKSSKLYDGKFGLSVKVAKASRVGINFRYIDMFNYYSFVIDFRKSEVLVDK